MYTYEKKKAANYLLRWRQWAESGRSHALSPSSARVGGPAFLMVFHYRSQAKANVEPKAEHKHIDTHNEAVIPR